MADSLLADGVLLPVPTLWKGKRFKSGWSGFLLESQCGFQPLNPVSGFRRSL